MAVPGADVLFMDRALALAARGVGLTAPNPSVGAVVVSHGEPVGEGYHRQAGCPHAEVEALTMAGPQAKGATLYVTLEPCAHYGRTPPCTQAILGAGIGRVVVAVPDPNPLVDGKGVATLRSHGIEVSIGVGGSQAAAMNRPFFKFVTTGRPYVVLKIAMTLDGKIADREGRSRWITGEAAREYSHRLRFEADAILVGIGTVLKDDPQLTVRLPGVPAKEPYRVVLDSQGRIPAGAALMASGEPSRTLIVVSKETGEERLQAIKRRGATVLPLPSSEGRVDLEALLDELGRRQVTNLLVEGGAEVAASFLEATLVDRIVIFVAPKLLGGREAPGPVGGRGWRLSEAVPVHTLTARTVGEDLVLEGELHP